MLRHLGQGELVTTSTIAQTCDAVAATLGAATGIARVQSYSQISESVTHADLPFMQVYWQSMETDISNETDRTTFGAGMRQVEQLYHVDIFVCQRAMLAEDMEALVTIAENVETELDKQNRKPYFGDAGMMAFHWRMERVNFSPDSPDVYYPGLRVFLTVRKYKSQP